MPPVGSRWTMRSFKRLVSIGPDAIEGSPVIVLPEEFADDSRSYKATAIQSVTADYDVLSRDRFGATTIRLTYRKLLDYETFGAVGAEISRTPPGGAERIDGATITFKQGPDGRIWNVLDTRGFVRRYLQSNGMTDEKLLRKTLASNHVPSNAEVAQYVNQQQGNLPVFPVRAGESWQSAILFPTMSTVEISGTRTLKTLDSKTAVIASSARFDGNDPQRKLAEVPDANLDYSQLKGTATGIERVERSSGLALETNLNTALKGRVSALSRGAKGDKTRTSDINVTSTLRVVLEPR